MNGRHIDEPHALDLRVLARSLQSPSLFAIWTCGCGDAGCADIHDGVTVEHQGDAVTWQFLRPQSCPAGPGDLDEQMQRWHSEATPVQFHFSRRQMITALDETLQQLLNTPENSSYSPHGFEHTDLVALAQEVRALFQLC